MLCNILDKISTDKIFRRTKFSTDKIFRRTKFSTLTSKFDSFVRRNFVQNIRHHDICFYGTFLNDRLFKHLLSGIMET